MFLIVPTPSRDLTEEGRKAQEYEKGVPGGIENGKEINIRAYEDALNKAGTTHEEARKYWNDVSNYDPYSKAGKDIDEAIASQAPKVSIGDNGRISISAPKAVLESPLVAQIQNSLQSLKGSDIKSPEFSNAINALNEEIRSNLTNTLVQETFGWTPEEFNDYQYTIQTVNTTNPMQSSNKVKGADKDGKIVMKTPQEWIDYYRSAYNTDERTDAFYKSLQASSPYERTMALIMSKGRQNPVYGFDTLERVSQGVASFWNQMMKLPEGSLRLISTTNQVKRVEDLNRDLKIPTSALRDFSIANEEQFEAMKNSIKGKKWGDLSDTQKAFLLELGVSKENESTRSVDRGLFRGGEDYYHAKDLQNMAAENDSLSREAIDNILLNNSFDRYKQVRNDYDTFQGYDEETNKDDERLAKNAIWSSAEQTIGNFAGTIGRFLWENALGKAATGGKFSMNKISDEIGAGIVKGLANRGLSPISSTGQGVLQFAANLVGTIPEDIIQTSVDNILTYNAGDNAKLLTGEEISQNFKNNLVWMAGFNMARAGISALKRARIAKKAAKANDLDQKIDINAKMEDGAKAAEVVENGGEIKVEGDNVKAVSADGTETPLKNTTPEEAKLIQLSLFDQVDEPAPVKVESPDTNVKADAIEPVDVTPAKTVTPWDIVTEEDGYSAGTRAAREYIAETSDIDVSNPTVDGSVAWWFAGEWNGEHPDADVYEKWMMLPEEFRNELLANEQFRAIWENNEPGKAAMQITTSADLPDVIDRMYADFLYRKEMGGGVQTPAAAATSAEPETPKTEVEESTQVSLFDEATEEQLKPKDEQPKTMVDIDTPDGPKRVETVDYNFKTTGDAIGAEVDPTPAGMKQWHTRALQAAMKGLKAHIDEFKNRFGDVRVSDFDWVWYNTKKGLTPDQIVGTVDPSTGRVITQNMIDAMKWWGEQPFVKDLRMASRKALGYTDDMNVLGYLPHTNYDPSTLSYDEALTGRLWQTASGSSVIKDGRYIGYGGTFEGRYRTFASNMLWDAKNTDVAVAKLLEEAEMDGREITPELVADTKKAVEGEKNIRKAVDEAPSTKKLAKALSSEKSADEIDWKEIDDNVKQEAPESGLGKAIHDNYQDVYYGAGTDKVVSQPSKMGTTFDSQSDAFRKTKIGNGKSFYDWGAADLVYSAQNAVELVTRFMREGGDFRAMLVEYIENHSHRSTKYAEAVADKWIAKMNSTPGEMTKGKAIASLTKSMKSEALGRIRKWLVMADYDSFDTNTKKMIDRFLYTHMQTDAITNNPTIGQRLTNGLNKLTEYRYRALFYGNIKNALLQVSELSRLFTSFNFGDVSLMVKRLATDADFRDRVNMYVEAVAPETTYLDAELYGKYHNVAQSMDIEADGVKFNPIKDAKETANAIGLAPIEAAESFKNRTMIAALVQEADSKGFTGDDALRYIRQRFERVALAGNEMGKIGLSYNPLAKPMLFLQNFQIRELGMHHYNIKDATGMAKSTPKAVLNAAAYLTKVLGTKMATTLLLSRLGYSATQTMGLDPFGLTDTYNKLDKEEMNWLDKQISGGILTPFFTGGMTSLIADFYFMARKAYEDSSRQTISDDVERGLEEEDLGKSLRFWEQMETPDEWKSFDGALGLATNFLPGSVFFNRLGQMNEMMDTGWATSSTGNKMYTAPEDWQNTALGYLFGRSATENAQQYNQTYGDSLGQALSRTVGKVVMDMLKAAGIGNGYQSFDPIDTRNYSDWFKGGDNDLQQFEKGRRYFQNQRDRIIDEYQAAISRGYDEGEIAEAKNNMNEKLESLYDQLERFVKAYETKNGPIDAAMTKKVINLLNTGRKFVGDTPEESEARGLEDYSNALERYASRDLPAIGTYTGPTEKEPDKEVKYQGSPQYRTAVSGKYDLNSEAVDVLTQADVMLSQVRKNLKDSLSAAYDREDYDAVKKIQKTYLEAFDTVVSPIIATYGVGILSSTDVVNKIKDMLSTGTVSRSGDLIPSDQYKKDKKGKFRSMPLETVDVNKWAQQRFSDDIYKNPSVRSYSTAEDDIMEIKRLSSEGKPGRALARAYQLKARVDNQQRSLSKSDYQWLLNFLNNGGKE